MAAVDLICRTNYPLIMAHTELEMFRRLAGCLAAVALSSAACGPPLFRSSDSPITMSRPEQAELSTPPPVQLAPPAHIARNANALFVNLQHDMPAPENKIRVSTTHDVGFNGADDIVAVLVDHDASDTVLVSLKNPGVITRRSWPGTGIVNCAKILRSGSVVRRCTDADGVSELFVEDVADGSQRVLPGKDLGQGPVLMDVSAASGQAVCCDFETFSVWNLNAAQSPRKVEKPIGLAPFAIHPHVNIVATGCPMVGGYYSLSTGQQTEDVGVLSSILLGAIAFSPSGKLLAAGGMGQDYHERVWIGTFDDSATVLDVRGTGTRTSWIEFSSSERLVASIDSTSIVSLWDLQRKTCACRFVSGEAITGGAAFSADDTRLALGCNSGIKVYRVSNLLGRGLPPNE